MGPVVEVTEDEVRVVLADASGWRVYRLEPTGRVVLVEDVRI